MALTKRLQFYSHLGDEEHGAKNCAKEFVDFHLYLYFFLIKTTGLEIS